MALVGNASRPDQLFRELQGNGHALRMQHGLEQFADSEIERGEALPQVVVVIVGEIADALIRVEGRQGR